MARSGSEPAVTRKQRCAEFFRENDVRCIVNGKSVTASPNLRQQHEMGVARNSEVLQIKHCLLSTGCRNCSFTHQAPEDLGNFEIQEVRSMQGLVLRVDALFDALSGRCLKEPLHCGGRIENDHLASRSSRTRRAVSSSTETGLRL